MSAEEDELPAAAAELSETTVEERLKKHDEVLKSYRKKFEEHKQWLSNQGLEYVAPETPNPAAAGSPPPVPRMGAPKPTRHPRRGAHHQQALGIAGDAADVYAGHPDSPQAQQRRDVSQPGRCGGGDLAPEDLFRDAAQHTTQPLRVYDRVTQWQRRREQRLREARERKEVGELRTCTFSPPARSPAPSRARSEETIYGGDGRAWGFHEFVERQREARRRSSEGRDAAFCTGKNWRNQVTVPVEFRLGKRDRPIKALQRPFSAPSNSVASADGGGGAPAAAGRHDTALSRESALHADSLDPALRGTLPRAGLFSERVCARIMDYAMNQPGAGAGGAPSSVGGSSAPVPPQGHFSKGQVAHVAPPEPPPSPPPLPPDERLEGSAWGRRW